MKANIDLTEHRDFGGETEDNWIDIPIELNADGIMDSGQYERLLRWESIFGSKRRYPSKSNIFGKASNELSDMFIPWRISNKNNNAYLQFIRIPWKSQNNASNRDPIRDLFDSR